MMEDDLQSILALQRRLHAQVHDLVNILAIFQAETDLAIDHARQRLTDWSARYPAVDTPKDLPGETLP
jgi:hypothetical protein